MKKKYYFVILFLMLTIFFIINTSSVNATMYKILDSEGNIIRLTNNPVLSNKEKEAGCTIYPPLDEQEIKQEVSSGSEKYDFRKTNWGMNKEQVRAIEDNKPKYENNNVLEYEMDIYEKYSLCAYYFLEDKLYQGRYTLNNVIRTDYNDYIYDYKYFKEILIQKYGNPKIMGRLDSGLDCWVLWETSTTKIELKLGGEYPLRLFLSYTSKELEEWVKQTEVNKAKSNF